MMTEKNNFDDKLSQKLLEFVQAHPTKYSKILLSKNPKILEKYGNIQLELLPYIYQCTPKLDDKLHTLKTRIYWVLARLEDFPRCLHDGKPLVEFNVKSVFHGYQAHFCSATCRNAYTASEESRRVSNCELSPRFEATSQDEFAHFKDETKLAKLSKTKRTISYNDFILKRDAEYEPMFTLEEYLSATTAKTMLKWKHIKCGSVFESKYYIGRHDVCPFCTLKLKKRSYAEEDLHEVVVEILQNSGHVVLAKSDLNVSLMPNHEFDLLVPDLKVAIEYNGMFWHSTDAKGLGYHLHKTKWCEEHGWLLVHIWEDEWLSQRDKTIELLKMVLLTHSVDFHSLSDDLFEVDRSKFNLANDFVGYGLVRVDPPTIITSAKGFKVEDCGRLVFKKSQTIP